MSYNFINKIAGGPITIAVNPDDLRDMIVDAVKQAVVQPVKEESLPRRNYLNSDEVMERLSISRSTLDRKRRMGILVPVKIGKLNRYRIEDVELLERVGE